jgi:hypothetical protein
MSRMSVFVAFVPFCSRLVCSLILEQKKTEETKENPIHFSSVVSRSLVAPTPLARDGRRIIASPNPKSRL